METVANPLNLVLTTSFSSYYKVIMPSGPIPLGWASRFSIAVGVAQGLASLHGCQSGPILHFDLTSKTIMLKSPKEPKLEA